MKLGVFSDLHLGKSRHIPGRLADQRRAWQDGLDVFRARGCDVVIFAGDATDKRRPDNDEREAFQEPLVGYPIPVVAITGNHDLEHAEKPTAIDLAAHGGLLIASCRPELIPTLDGRLVVATVPYTKTDRVRAWCHDMGIDADPDKVAGELLGQIVEKLAEQARDLYPDAVHVLAGHYPTTDWAVPSGFQTSLMHTAMVPLAAIVRANFDAAIFGDIHLPGEISTSPLVLSPGSPLPLDHGEAGCEHGCYIVEFAPRMRREAPSVEFVPLESRRFHTIELDAIEVEDAARGEFLFGPDEFAGEIVRARYSVTAEQAARVTRHDVEAALIAAGAHHATAEPTTVHESRARVEGLVESVAPLDALEAYLGSQEPAWPVGLADGVRAWSRGALAEVAA